MDMSFILKNTSMKERHTIMMFILRDRLLAAERKRERGTLLSLAAANSWSKERELGKSIGESLVILEYIEETWKQTPLLPEDPYQKPMLVFGPNLVMTR